MEKNPKTPKKPIKPSKYFSLTFWVRYPLLQSVGIWVGDELSEPMYNGLPIIDCVGVKTDKELWQGEHSCSSCGYETDRDYNATINILHKGLGEGRAEAYACGH